MLAIFAPTSPNFWLSQAGRSFPNTKTQGVGRQTQRDNAARWEMFVGIVYCETYIFFSHFSLHRFDKILEKLLYHMLQHILCGIRPAPGIGAGQDVTR